MDPFRRTLLGHCPHGLCDVIKVNSEVLVIALLVDAFFFLVTLLPCVFTWSNKKQDGKKRIFFAAFACVTFYFWLAFLVLNSIYCFGFLAHQGPCLELDAESVEDKSTTADVMTTSFTTASNENPAGVQLLPTPQPLIWRTSNESCDQVITEHEADLRNITILNVLIIITLIITLLANAKEVFNAKALYHKETLCRKEEVQKFLNSLVSKPPEVGHFVTCFHPAKSVDSKGNLPASSRKIVTFSAIENFAFQSWRDFSDVRLIEPSSSYPIIEIEVVLNFFPGDHFTAERYKSFVLQLTKEHSGKDVKINIDDYFHIEDRREWTFFVGNPRFISPWYERGAARVLLSGLLLFGWPLRLAYSAEIAKHKVEIKKAVFCENSSQDEGVSLTATPGSDSNDAAATATVAVAASPVRTGNNTRSNSHEVERPAMPPAVTTVAAEHHRRRSNEHRVDAMVTAEAHYNTMLPPPMKCVPLTSPRTHLRESTKDMVRTVVSHQAGSGGAPVALKDIDVQMTTISGYETYV